MAKFVVFPRRRIKRNVTAGLFCLAVWFTFAMCCVAQRVLPAKLSGTPGNGSAGTSGVVNVIVVGANGNLAKKYLWQGFFNLVNEEEGSVFHLFAGSRSPQANGEREMSQILDQNVSCSRTPPSLTMATDECEKAKALFRDSIPYHQLKTAENYRSLCSAAQHKMSQMGLSERGRIFYLSVPAFAYAEIASHINKECRPQGGAWLRVVLEKPFGHDTASARELSRSLKAHLEEREIYRIDHYLGKTGVQSILPFRELNQHTLGKMWNRGSVEKVEIILKETVDVKDRVSFYDKYGVIRDVMQNHLTEILALVAMEIPSNLSSVSENHQAKLALLGQVDYVTSQQAVIGQYDSYADEWSIEMQKSVGETTLVPSFAGVLLHVSNPLWSGVPFLMVSGKKLDEKLVYVRVVFKNSDFCTVTPNYEDGDYFCKPKQVVFFIGSGKYPTVAVSKSLPKPEVPVSWTVPTVDPGTSFLGQPMTDFYLYSAGVEADPYSSLIKECFLGNRDKFIGSADLVASWDIWTPLLHSLADVPPRLYPGGLETGRWLDLTIQGHKLRFSHEVDQEWDVDSSQRFAVPATGSIPRTFRSKDLYTGSKEETVSHLAMHLLTQANAAISERGVFHMALPGGTTPETLLRHLYLRMRHTFPWRDTHVWFTDERCVPLTSQGSNFHLINFLLLQFLSIPYTNIHPMPVQLARGLCTPEDDGHFIYASEIQRVVPDSRFDYVILGVGRDGHIASLFPRDESLRDITSFVLVSKSSQLATVQDRMSLGYAAINSARNIAIHILGEKKHSLVEKIKSERNTNSTEFPVLGVQSLNGNMSWFIDHDALL